MKISLDFVDLWVWRSSGFCLPAPESVKRSVLASFGFGLGTWVETGTFLGDTTSWLGRHGTVVWSIEASPELCAVAQRRFQHRPNVNVVCGESQLVLGEVLTNIEGSIGFWLDGHYSGGDTHRGVEICPVETELGLIGSALGRLGDVVVFVDDVRLFVADDGYPGLEVLVAWATQHGFSWIIQHDVFVAASEARIRKTFRH
jgi:hypothetical protein